MKQSLTGRGGLPRKLSAILLSAAMLVAGLSFAADNSIYIDQTGDNATIAVTQDGTSNVVRGIQGVGSSNATPAKIIGDGNQVSVTQTGNSNTLSMGINRGAGTQGNNVTYSVTGNSAAGIINMNNANASGSSAGDNTVGITQAGNNASANLNLVGNSNAIGVITSGGANNAYTSTVAGDSNTQTISLTGGGGNGATVNQTDSGHTATITSVGATNSYTVNQSGGASGHTTALDFNGSSNTVNVTQQGTAADNIANIKSAGSSNSFTINQNAR